MIAFTAYVFKGKRTAQKALDSVEDSSDNYPWIDDVAVVSKSSLGQLTIRSTWAQDNLGESGFGWGAFTGGLLGLLAGPQGALAGAALGGSIWGIFGMAMDDEFDDPKLDKFGKELKKDTSALVLVSDDGYTSEYEAVFGSLGGTIIQTDLDGSDVKFIKKKIEEFKNNY